MSSLLTVPGAIRVVSTLKYSPCQHFMVKVKLLFKADIHCGREHTHQMWLQLG